MGKIRRDRRKFHLAAKKSDSNENDDGRERSGQTAEDKQTKIPFDKSTPVLNPKTLFSGIKIDFDSIAQQRLQLDELDKKSVISLKSKSDAAGSTCLEKKMKKKDKHKLKRETFIQKIQEIHTAAAEHKKKKHRKKLKSFSNGRKPQLLAIDNKQNNLNTVKKRNGLKKLKKNKKNKKTAKALNKNMLNDIAQFKKTLTKEEFKADPQTAILKHIKKTLEKEKAE